MPSQYSLQDLFLLFRGKFMPIETEEYPFPDIPDISIRFIYFYRCLNLSASHIEHRKPHFQPFLSALFHHHLMKERLNLRYCVIHLFAFLYISSSPNLATHFSMYSVSISGTVFIMLRTSLICISDRLSFAQ